MSGLGFEAVSHGELRSLSAGFGEGGRVLLGSEADGTNTLLMLAAGVHLPRRGRVLLDAVAPAASCTSRRGIAALFAHEVLPPARTVAAALELSLAARGDARSGSSVLDAAGLASWAMRRPASLSAREIRAVALALALSHPEPKLFALYEPLALLDLLNEDFVLGVLARHAEAVVLCSVSRAEEASKLGAIAGTLVRGEWRGNEPARAGRSPITLRVLTPNADRLAARLRGSSGIVAVEWSGKHELLVHGAGLEATARSVLENARAESIPITALKPEGAR